MRPARLRSRPRTRIRSSRRRRARGCWPRNDFAPFAGLTYGDQPAISFQGHPEFAPSFAKALLALGHTGQLAPTDLDRLMDTLDHPNDNARIGAWIGRFLRGEALAERVRPGSVPCRPPFAVSPRRSGSKALSTGQPCRARPAS